MILFPSDIFYVFQKLLSSLSMLPLILQKKVLEIIVVLGCSYPQLFSQQGIFSFTSTFKNQFFASL